MLRLWKNMDEDDKARLVKTTGFVVAIFTVFTLLAECYRPKAVTLRKGASSYCGYCVGNDY